MVAAIDTIYSLSSGALPSGVAVIRVSGPAVMIVYTSLCIGPIKPRIASLKTIRSRNGAVLDQGIVILFPGPGSFTGEDCLELQVHGGRAVVSAILDEIGTLPGLRQAEAGEFSRRAFENAKLDLVEIEGLADLIAADTEMQRRLAHEQAQGGTSALYAGWAKRLTHARAMIEAELDFADEDDVPGSVSRTIWQDMGRLDQEISEHLDGAKTGAIIRDGFKVVISGAPNVGKSSLLNMLAQRDVAIVTEIAGTTRDVLAVDIALEGYAVKLYDTAGLRETTDKVEQEGIRRARELMDDADLVLCLSDDPNRFLEPEDGKADVLRVGTKIDLGRELWDRANADVLVSTRNAKGILPLLMAIAERLPQATASQSLSIPSRRRHSDQLHQCLDSLRQASGANGLDLQSEHLRQSGDALGRITGRVGTEDLLDVIFSEFCIGK